MGNNIDFLFLMKVEGLPMMTGQLDRDGRRRATQLAEELDCEQLAFALVERERQLAQMIDKLRERS